MRKSLLVFPFLTSLLPHFPITARSAVLVSESLGSVSSTTAIPTHEAADGFDHDAFAFSGTGDIRSTAASSGYAGASGGANAFLTSSGSSTFVISGISTLGHMAGSVDLVFGAYKSTVDSDMTTLKLEYSSNGSAWTQLAIPAQLTGTGTASWRQISFSDAAIPITSSLFLRWTNTDTVTAYRLDDIALTAMAIPEPAVAAMAAGGWLGLLRRRRAGA